MKLIVIIATLFLINSLVAREISSHTLDELESLIKAYKESSKRTNVERSHVNAPIDISTDAELQKSAETSGLKVVGKITAKQCGTKIRFTYEQCLSLSKSIDEQSTCARTFVDEYPKCYFGDSLDHGSKDISVCEGSCLWNFDHCLSNSNKVEMFICIGGRNQCSAQCPWPAHNEKRERVSKGECYGKCEGSFDVCFDAIVVFTEQMICNANRYNCRKNSCNTPGKPF